jgi:hypothetical protein
MERAEPSNDENSMILYEKKRRIETTERKKLEYRGGNGNPK